MRRLRKIALPLALLVVCGTGCRDKQGHSSLVADASASTDGGPLASDAGVTMAPLDGNWIERIDLPGGGLVYVTPPVGSTEPRPVIVGIHGAIDDAGQICSAWRLVADAYPFVVCPAGSKVRKDTYVWSSPDAIDKAVDMALAAVREKYGARVKEGPAIYAAFSQGANMAGGVLGRKPGRFARAALTEGGYRAFETLGAASAFARAGGERVLFACAQAGCAGSFEGSRGPLLRSKVDVHVTYAGPHGHSMPPPVREAVHAELAWLTEGLPGWSTYAAAPKLTTH